MKRVTLRGLVLAAGVALVGSSVAHSAPMPSADGLRAGKGSTPAALDFWGDPFAGLLKDLEPLRMHTDLPDLPPAPDRWGFEPIDPASGPGIGAFSGDSWAHAPSRSKPGPDLIWDHGVPGRLTRMASNADGDPFTRIPDGGRVHTDVPDLPKLVDPSVSHMPEGKPGSPVHDWHDPAGPVKVKPQLEFSTVPTPGTIALMGIGAIAVLRRRR